MVNLNFSIRHQREVVFKNFWFKDFALPFKNKFVELAGYNTHEIVAVEFKLTRRTSHAGMTARFALFGLTAHLIVYDARHWDSDNDCYSAPDAAIS